MNYPKYDQVVDFKVNYESFDVINGSLPKIESRIPTSSMVSLILPEEKVVKEIQDLLDQCRYFTLAEFQLCDIFHKSFLDAFIKIGNFECVASAESSVCDQKISIERNVLHLTVPRDACHENPIFELIQFKIKEDEEFSRFKIDLTDIPPKNDLSKLREEIRSLVRPATISFAYHSNSDLSSFSVAKYFKDLGREVKTLENVFKSTKEFDLRFPNIDDEDLTTLYDASEFFGMIILGQSLDENDLHSLQHQPEAVELGKGTSILIRGFIAPQVSMEILKILQNALNTSEHVPWLGMSCTGFNQKSKFVILKKNGKVHLL